MLSGSMVRGGRTREGGGSIREELGVDYHHRYGNQNSQQRTDDGYPVLENRYGRVDLGGLWIGTTHSGES